MNNMTYADILNSIVVFDKLNLIEQKLKAVSILNSMLDNGIRQLQLTEGIVKVKD